MIGGVLVPFTVDDIRPQPNYFGRQNEGLTKSRKKIFRIHPYQALSAALVRNESEPGAYCDGNCLYLVIDENGSKKWVLRVTINGKRRDLGLGSTRLVSLAEARNEAIRLRKIARAGGDPLAEKREKKIQALQKQQQEERPTFETVAREVHDAESKTFRNPTHAKQWIWSLEEYVFPSIGNRRIDQVTPADVKEVLLSIWFRIPETARRVRQRMKAVFESAKADGHRSGDNPVDVVAKALPKHNTKQKHHAALPHADLPAFILKLREYEGVSARLAFEFLILTASRTSEVLLAKWSEIDTTKKTWTVPADRMKARVEHRVPLSQRCLQILEEAKKISIDGSPFVFPGVRLKKPLSNMTFDMAIRRLDYEITAHGFRSTFRDWCEEKTSFPNSVIEMSLAHTVKNKVEAAYLRTNLFERRQKLMEAWSAYATSSPAKVVAMSSRVGA